MNIRKIINGYKKDLIYIVITFIFIMLALLLSLFLKSNEFYITFISFLIASGLTDFGFFRQHRKFKYLNCVFSYLLFVIINFTSDYKIFFIYSPIVIIPILGFLFSKLSLKYYNREISIIGGSGFNIKKEHSLIDIVYGLVILIFMGVISFLIF